LKAIFLVTRTRAKAPRNLAKRVESGQVRRLLLEARGMNLAKRVESFHLVAPQVRPQKNLAKRVERLEEGIGYRCVEELYLLRISRRELKGWRKVDGRPLDGEVNLAKRVESARPSGLSRLSPQPNLAKRVESDSIYPPIILFPLCRESREES